MSESHRWGSLSHRYQWLRVSQAVPVHFAHNALVLGTQAGEEFHRAVSSIAASVTVNVMKPGDTRQIRA